MATFHPDYAHLTQGLPPSQLALAVKRLTTGRKAISAEAVSELGERQQEVLTAIAAAYARKKERSRSSSQKRRDEARNLPGSAQAQCGGSPTAAPLTTVAPPPSPAPPTTADSELPDIEPIRLDEPESDDEPDDDEPEPAPASAPAPAPAPAPVRQPAPAPVAPVRQPAPAPAPAPAPVPEKTGEPVRASASRRGRKLFVNQY